jgi:uncharacterized protein (DUF1330 family)
MSDAHFDGESAMTAQVIFSVKKVLDQAALVEYRKLAHATIEAAKGRIVSKFDGYTALEGNDFIAMVIVEFETRAAAEAWYHGAPYQEASKLRKKGSECVVSLVSW